MESKKVILDLEQLDQLEKRVQRATETIHALRKERDMARTGLAEARAEVDRLRDETRRLEVDTHSNRALSEELGILREERQAIRGRVTRMLEMMATLDEVGAPARSDH